MLSQSIDSINFTRPFIDRKRTRLPHLALLYSAVARASSIFSHGVKYRPESHSSLGNGANSGQRIALLTGSLDGRRDFQCLRWNAKSSYGQHHPGHRRRRCNKRRRRCIEAILHLLSSLRSSRSIGRFNVIYHPLTIK